jgi:hypothetical protein
MYAFLADHDAKECAGDVAFFLYSCGSDDVLKELKEDLEQAVTLTKKSRIYVICETGKQRFAQFLIGKRPLYAPWAHCGEDQDAQDDLVSSNKWIEKE